MAAVTSEKPGSARARAGQMGVAALIGEFTDPAPGPDTKTDTPLVPSINHRGVKTGRERNVDDAAREAEIAERKKRIECIPCLLSLFRVMENPLATSWQTCLPLSAV